MDIYLIMLTLCVVTQRIYSKSLFDYNINPVYDLDAAKSTSNMNFWPNSEFYVTPQIRFKHHAGGRGHGKGNGRRNHDLPPHAFDLSDGYFYPDSSEEYSGEIFHSPHDHPHPHPPHHHHRRHGHPHGIPPGQAKKHGSPYGHPHDPPRRFPPPPVYDKDFINPWAIPAASTPKQLFVQQPPLTTPQPFIVQHPSSTTATTIRTTLVSPSPTVDDDKLIYDIDVRFGRD